MNNRALQNEDICHLHQCLLSRFENLIEEAKSEIDSYKNKFLQVHLDSESSDPFYLSIISEQNDLLNNYLHDLRAFTILSHATIENFFEDFLKLILDYEERKINNSSSNKLILVHFSIYMSKKAYAENGFMKSTFLNILKNIPIKPEAILLKKLKESTEKLINKNHGITKKYLKDMFEPIGFGKVFDDAEYSNFIDLCDKISKYRGKFAHSKQAVIFSIQELINFKDVIADIDNLLNESRNPFNEILNNLQ